MSLRPRRTLDRRFVEADVLTLARERLAAVFDRFDHVAVMCSGGKDSTVCLHLTLEEARRRERLPLDVIFFDEEAIPFQTEQYLRRLAALPGVALRWYALPVKHRNACSRRSPWWWPWAPEDRERWVRPMPPEAITDLVGFPSEPPAARLSIPDLNGLLFDPATYGTVAMVMGIRAQESPTRLTAVTRRTLDNYVIPYQDRTRRGNLWKVYPIYDWKTEDVWTAPKRFGWDYNRAYNAFEQAGIPTWQQRCSPAFGEEPIQKLWQWAVCFPEVWEKMIARMPGAATAARYATTELYGFGQLPPKPAGMAWEAFLLHYLERFEPVSRHQIAGRLRQEITMHYGKTADPIVERAPHPLTGMSWQYLLKIAMRGDFKKRRHAASEIDTHHLERHWTEYRKERATWQQ